MLTTGEIINSMRPGLEGFWGLGYKRHPEQFSQIYSTSNSNLNFERVVNLRAIGLPKAREEGAITAMDDVGGEGFKYDFIPVEFVNSFKVSHRAVLFNQYQDQIKNGLIEMANGFREAKEIVCARPFNSCTSSSITYADGQPLLSRSHSFASGGTYSNMLDQDTSLNELALTDAVTRLMGYTDDRGKLRMVNPMQVIVHKADWANVQRLLNSDLRVGTPNNDINVFKGNAVFPRGALVWRYLDSTNQRSWFIQTDCEKNAQIFQVEGYTLKMEEEPSTDSIINRAREMYSHGITDTMSFFGSVGAV